MLNTSRMIPSFDLLAMLCLMHPRLRFTLLSATAHYRLILSLLSGSTPRSLPAVRFAKSKLISGFTP